MSEHPVHASGNWRTPKPPSQDASASTPAKPTRQFHDRPRNQRPTQESSEKKPQPTPPGEAEATAAAIAEGRRIYVGNLVYHAQPTDVTTFFEGEGYTISRLAMSMDPFTGRNPSYCFVELDSRAAADDAIARLNGVPLLNRAMKVRPCVPKTQEQHGRWAPRYLGEDSIERRWEGRQTSQVEQEASGESFQQDGRRLYVGGLPRRGSQAEFEALIRDLFQGFEIVYVGKIRTPVENPMADQTSTEKRYFGFVEFSSPEVGKEAQLTINGKMIEGKKLRVQLAKGKP